MQIVGGKGERRTRHTFLFKLHLLQLHSYKFILICPHIDIIIIQVET